MPIPTYDKLMLPLLQFAGDGKPHHIRDAIIAIADYLQLSDDDRQELLPTGRKFKFDDRVQWANTYLKKAGLLQSAGRGIFQITPRGMDVLSMNLSSLDNDFLMQFPEFAEFKMLRKKSEVGNFLDYKRLEQDEQTPKDQIEELHQQLRDELAEDLLEYILSSSPAFFERLVVDLLLAMGYGGALENAGQTIGRSGDGGIDGYIQEDKLGLDVIYLQAKRWDRNNTVGRPAVQAFAGSLMGAGATKGVFITTSRFSQEAIQYARNIHNLKVILIDGEQLAQLMIEHGVGVSVEKTYVIKKIDENYFPDVP